MMRGLKVEVSQSSSLSESTGPPARTASKKPAPAASMLRRSTRRTFSRWAHRQMAALAGSVSSGNLTYSQSLWQRLEAPTAASCRQLDTAHTLQGVEQRQSVPDTAVHYSVYLSNKLVLGEFSSSSCTVQAAFMLGGTPGVTQTLTCPSAGRRVAGCLQ